MDERRETLRALLAAQLPLDQIAARLTSFEWDSEELVELRTEHVVAVLERFLEGGLLGEDVHTWADLVETRDDIGVEQQHQEALRQVMYQLATPELEGELDDAVARSLIEKLKA